MEKFNCYKCNKQMPGPLLKPMVHISKHRALVIPMCPPCQQKYSNNPNYHHVYIAPAVIALEAKRRRLLT